MTPDFSRNFLKLPLTVLQDLSDDPVALRVYVELLKRVAWQAGPRLICGRMVDLAVGQCVAGRRDLADATSTSEQTIRTALNHLQTHQHITVESTKLGSVVTLCGYYETTRVARPSQPSDLGAINQGSNHAERASATNASTTIRDPEDPRSDSLPHARAIPGSTADPAPTTASWTAGTADLVARATAAGVDVGEELAALADSPHWNPSAPTEARQRMWLRRAIKHASEHASGTSDAASGRQRAARSVQRGGRADGAPRRRETAEELVLDCERAARTASPEERSRWLAEDIAAIASDLGVAQEGAA